MGVRVAEYLGIKTDSDDIIAPPEPESRCPFANIECMKIANGDKPVCSVRKETDQLWIVCRHRLCSSSGNNLTEYQKDILHQIARELFNPDITRDETFFKKEVAIPTGIGRSIYHADFVLGTLNPQNNTIPSRVLVEVQGGGETSNTGKLSRHIEQWEINDERTNELLRESVDGVGTIETNAWRRQQEQILVKGNTAVLSGFGFVFCIGESLFNFLDAKIGFHNLRNLRNAAWNFVVVPFREVDEAQRGDSIALEIDRDRIVFTNFQEFSRLLINQGQPLPDLFRGNFTSLEDDQVSIER